jgi:hypothetical protein
MILVVEFLASPKVVVVLALFLEGSLGAGSVGSFE